MHRAILGLSDPRVKGDHVSHDTLDNRRLNLRRATNAENVRNSRMRVSNSCGVKGVTQKGTKFSAQISVDGKKFHLGRFHTIKEAGAAYSMAAERHHGAFACAG